MDKPFFAVFVERSRRYPVSIDHYTEIIEFDDEDKLCEWIGHTEGLLFDRKKYRAVKCLPITVKSTLDIKVSIDCQEE